MIVRVYVDMDVVVVVDADADVVVCLYAPEMLTARIRP